MFTTLKKYISRTFVFPVVEITPSGDLSGVIAVVTGASRGIGKAITEVILVNGGSVVAVSRSQEDLKSAFPNKSSTLLFCEADITIESDVQRIISCALDGFGGLTVLVNNAGINTQKALEHMSLSEYKEIMDINMKGIFLLSKYAIPGMKNQKSGFILNIGSKISQRRSQ